MTARKIGPPKEKKNHHLLMLITDYQITRQPAKHSNHNFSVRRLSY